MGSFRRSAILCSIIQVWSMVVLGEDWTFAIPERMSAPIGSCMVIPCSFTPPMFSEPVQVTWYQYVSSGYPLAFSESSPGDVIYAFRGNTELVGSKRGGNCSLKIYPARELHNAEQLYVWIEPNQLSSRFYDKTVTLQVTEYVRRPVMRASSEDMGWMMDGDDTSSRINLQEGCVLTLYCDATHTCPPHPPSVSFRDTRGSVRQSHAMEEAGLWRVVVEMSWTLSFEDNGRSMVCDVTHHGGLTASREVVLHVTYPPKSVRIHGDRTTLSSVSLSCLSQGNPSANSFTWYWVAHGRLRRLPARTSKTAVITELNRNQNLFRCTASNSMGSGTSSDFEVIQEYKPSISEASQCTFLAGSLSCSCEATARPQASIQWKVGGVTKTTQSSSTNGYAVTGKWAGQGMTEHVRVTCISTNGHGQAERILRVNVKAPPTGVQVTQSPPRPREGAGVTLTCTGQGNPPVSGYRWYRSQEELQGRSRDLRVDPVSRGSEPYRCVALNDAGGTSSPLTRLNVEYAPDILPDSRCTLGDGQFRCECVVDSNPAAEVTWSSVGSLTNEHNTSSTLSGRVLRSVLSGPMGGEGRSFYCNATNQHGDAFYQLELPVGRSGRLPLVLGACGGGLGLCLLLAAAFCFIHTKRQHKHTPSADLSLKDVKDIGEEEDKMDDIYENTMAPPPNRLAPENVYEVEDEPRYQELKREPNWSKDEYQTF